MKKIFLILTAALCCTTFSAQRLRIQKKGNPSAELSLDGKATLTLIEKGGSPRFITPATSTIITNQPAGEMMQNVVWYSRACYPNNGKATWIESTGFTPAIIINGNKMYIQSPLTQFADYATPWIVGNISADGQTVTFPTPQAYYNNSGSMTYATRLTSSGTLDASNTDLVFSYQDGELTQTDGGVLALTNATGGFYGYGDMNITVTKIKDKVVVLPADAQPKSYIMESKSGKQTAKVAFCGSDVYISDPVGTEDAWMKGALQCNTISLPTQQYLGAKSGYPLYLLSGKMYTYTQTNVLGQLETVTSYEILNDEAITFTYDAATGSFSSDQLMLVNSSKTALGAAYVGYNKPSYSPWTQVKATPANPSIQSFIDLAPYAMMGYYGCMLGCTVPSYSVEKEYMAQEDIYYTIFYDGEAVNIAGTSYLPYLSNYSDSSNGIYLTPNGDSHTVQTGNKPSSTVGIQSFYYVDEELISSDRIEYTINADGSLTQIVSDGIEEIEDGGMKMGKTVRYNLMGQRVNGKAKGIVIMNGKKVIKK